MLSSCGLSCDKGGCCGDCAASCSMRGGLTLVTFVAYVVGLGLVTWATGDWQAVGVAAAIVAGVVLAFAEGLHAVSDPDDAWRALGLVGFCLALAAAPVADADARAALAAIGSICMAAGLALVSETTSSVEAVRGTHGDCAATLAGAAAAAGALLPPLVAEVVLVVGYALQSGSAAGGCVAFGVVTLVFLVYRRVDGRYWATGNSVPSTELGAIGVFFGANLLLVSIAVRNDPTAVIVVCAFGAVFIIAGAYVYGAPAKCTCAGWSHS